MIKRRVPSVEEVEEGEEEKDEEKEEEEEKDVEEYLFSADAMCTAKTQSISHNLRTLYGVTSAFCWVSIDRFDSKVKDGAIDFEEFVSWFVGKYSH